MLDDSDRVVTDGVKKELREDLKQGLSLFSRTGMTTGAPELLKLFL